MFSEAHKRLLIKEMIKSSTQFTVEDIGFKEVDSKDKCINCVFFIDGACAFMGALDINPETSGCYLHIDSRDKREMQMVDDMYEYGFSEGNNYHIPLYKSSSSDKEGYLDIGKINVIGKNSERFSLNTAYVKGDVIYGIIPGELIENLVQGYSISNEESDIYIKASIDESVEGKSLAWRIR